MESLHSQAASHSYEITRETVRRALGKEIEEVFEEFSQNPIASGSIAQVHKAKLRNSSEFPQVQNKYVAVKVRHPGIESSISLDLLIIQEVCKFIGSFDAYKWLNLESNVITFSKSMKEQINLRVEANNLTKFIHNFKNITNVEFPYPVKKYSHPLLLVETWEEGVPINEFFWSKSNDKDLSIQLSKLGLVLYLKMVFFFSINP
jgi:aarF domain-containing kinase